MAQKSDAPAPPPAVISAFHEELSAASSEIAAASQELNVPVTAVENYLSSLNIHVPAWVKVKGWSTDQGGFWLRELGYDYVDGGWHIAIRESDGDEDDPERQTVRTWSFNRSPRKSRISAIDKLPELIQDVAKEAVKTARRLREKAAEANAFTASLPTAKPKK